MAVKNICFSEHRKALFPQSGRLTVLTENEQSSEACLGRRPDTSEDQEGCEEGLFSPRGSAGGLGAPAHFGKGCESGKVLRQQTTGPLSPGFQFLKATVNEALRNLSTL